MSLRHLPFLALLLPLMMACGGGEDRVDGGRDAPGGKRYGGVYRMNVLRGNPNALDPVLISSKHADDIASQIYDKLIDLDDSLRMIPELAREIPSISEDGRTYTFKLRTDVNFQNSECFPGGKGRRLTANDVRYSLTRGCDPRANTVAFWAFNDKVVGATEFNTRALAEMKKEMPEGGADSMGIPGFRVVDDSTFQIELIKPYAPFIFVLCNSLGSIVPHEAVEKYGKDFFRNPVGSGPFVFSSWRADQEIVLKRNPEYWGKDEHGNRLPLLDEIRCTFIKDDKVQLSEFMNGGLEESYNIPTERFADIFDLETRKPREAFATYQIQQSPAMLTWFFDFNTTKRPFDRREVRRAFSFAVDRAKIVRFALQNSPFGPADHGIVPPVFPGYPVSSIKGYTFNPDSARRLLAEAGYPEGKGFPKVELTIYPEPRLRQVAEVVQEMLKSNLNVQVDIEVFDFPQLQDQADLGKLLFWGARWYGDYPDPETYLLLFNGELIPTDSTVKSYPNATRYYSADYIAAFNKGVSTIDPKAQMGYYARAEQIAMDDAPALPLFYDMHYRLLQPWVRDCPLDAMARYDLKYVWLAARE